MRLHSVDALRGLTVAAMLVVNNPGDWGHVYPGLLHAPWHGMRAADFVFPFFLLIVGVSISLAPRLTSRGVLLRALRIFALGLVLHAAAWWLLDGRSFRVMGVLQRIGLCFAFAGLVAIHLRDARLQWGLIGALLAGHAALLLAGGPLDQGVNISDRVDAALLGPHAYRFDAATDVGHEPEGLVSTLGAFATTLLGLRAGAWLRERETKRLLAAGVIAALLGAAATFVLPLNKALWTPSFVLWSAGFGLLALGLAHKLVDRRGWPALGRSLGINAIGAYAGAWLAACVLGASGVMAPLVAALREGLRSPELASLAFALGFTALWWLLAAWAARRGWRVVI